MLLREKRSKKKFKNKKKLKNYRKFKKIINLNSVFKTKKQKTIKINKRFFIFMKSFY